MAKIETSRWGIYEGPATQDIDALKRDEACEIVSFDHDLQGHTTVWVVAHQRIYCVLAANVRVTK